MNRREWKLNLIEKVNFNPEKVPVVNLPSDWTTLPEDFEYRRLVVTGRYLHDQEMFMAPRMLLTGNLKGGNLHNVDKYGQDPSARPDVPLARNKTGAWVVTPFLLPDGRKILGNGKIINSSEISLEIIENHKK